MVCCVSIVNIILCVALKLKITKKKIIYVSKFFLHQMRQYAWMFVGTMYYIVLYSFVLPQSNCKGIDTVSQGHVDDREVLITKRVR